MTRAGLRHLTKPPPPESCEELFKGRKQNLRPDPSRISRLILTKGWSLFCAERGHNVCVIYCCCFFLSCFFFFFQSCFRTIIFFLLRCFLFPFFSALARCTVEASVNKYIHWPHTPPSDHSVFLSNIRLFVMDTDVLNLHLFWHCCQVTMRVSALAAAVDPINMEK